MKRVLLITMAVIVVLTMAACGRQNVTTIVGVDTENKIFTVTPQEFVNNWNDTVSKFQKESTDDIAKEIILIPNYQKSGDKIQLTDGLYVILDEDEKSGMLKKLEIRASNTLDAEKGFLTFSFMLGSFPVIFGSPEHKSLADEFGISVASIRGKYKHHTDDLTIGDTFYRFVEGGQNSSIYIMPAG